MSFLHNARTPMGAAVIVLALALAACNSNEGVTAKDASMEDVAEDVAKSDVALRPGRWETSMSMAGDATPVPGAGKGSVATCLTKADLDQFDQKIMQKPMESCRYDNFTMANGRIQGAMSCNPPEGEGPTMKMTMDGTYTPETYDLAMTTEMSMGGQSKTTTMKMVSRRVGECDGTEVQAPST